MVWTAEGERSLSFCRRFSHHEPDARGALLGLRAGSAWPWEVRLVHASCLIWR